MPDMAPHVLLVPGAGGSAARDRRRPAGGRGGARGGGAEARLRDAAGPAHRSALHGMPLTMLACPEPR